jgi:TP901 family phage tail tape measure protein
MAGFNLGDVLVNIKANTDGLKKGLSDVQNMGDETKNLGDKIQKGMNVAAAAMGVVGAGLTVYAKKATDFTIDLVKSSTALGRQLGVSTEEASRLSAALGRMGIDSDKAQTLFGIFAKKIQSATEQTDAQRIAQEGLALQIRQTQQDIDKTTVEISKHGDKTGELGLKVETLKNKMAGLQEQMKSSGTAFDQLGISVKNADGTQKGFNQLLGEVADKFKAMPNGIEKTALSMELFGRSGKDMIKVLNLGSDGIADLEKQADKLGLTLTADTIVKINALIKSQKDLKQQTDALKISVGTATAPVLTEFNKKLNSIVQGLLDTHGAVHTATVGFLAFGGPVLSGTAGLIAFIANATQAAPALAKVAIALRDTAAAQWLLNIAMDANPIGLLILAIAALGVAIYEALTHMQQLGAFMVSLTDWFAQGWHPAILAAIAVFMPFVGLPLILITYWSQISGFFIGLWSFVSSLFSQHWQTILAIVIGTVFPIVGIIIGNFQSIVNFLVGAMNSIVNIVNNIGGWFGRLPGYAANAANGVVSFMAGLPGRILGAIGDLSGLLMGAGHAVMDGFLNALKGGFNKVKDFVSSIASWIKDHKGPVESDQKLLIPAGRAIFQGFGEGLRKEWGNVQDFINGIGTNLSGGFMGSLGLVGANGSMQTISNSTSSSSKTNIYGDINIGSKSDADYLLGRLDRNTQLESLGATPL